MDNRMNVDSQPAEQPIPVPGANGTGINPNIVPNLPSGQSQQPESMTVDENRGTKRSFNEMAGSNCCNTESTQSTQCQDLPPAVTGGANPGANTCCAPVLDQVDQEMGGTGEQTETTLKKEETTKEEPDWSHITEADLELKEFKCPRCSKAFKTTNDLFVHMRETYEDPTVCQVCGKNLNCMANVLSHSYLHQDVKPYHCPKCKYKTRTRFNLRVHFGSCAKLEKFSYKRGHCSKRRRTINTKNRKRAKRVNKRKIDLDDSGILSHMYDDILNQLADSGPYNDGERDVSCLVQVHIQHFPRTNANGTDRFYQQNEAPKRHQVQEVPPITDVSQFYAGVQPQQPQW